MEDLSQFLTLHQRRVAGLPIDGQVGGDAVALVASIAAVSNAIGQPDLQSGMLEQRLRPAVAVAAAYAGCAPADDDGGVVIAQKCSEQLRGRGSVLVGQHGKRPRPHWLPATVTEALEEARAARQSLNRDSGWFGREPCRVQHVVHQERAGQRIGAPLHATERSHGALVCTMPAWSRDNTVPRTPR